MFVVDNIPKPRLEDVVEIRHSRQTEKLRPGTICSKWDHVFLWDENCVKASILEQWRQHADPYCDEALLKTFPSSSSSIGVDLLEAIELRAAQGPGAARDFMEHVNRVPPEGVNASDAQICRGQAFFYKYSTPILAGLMHFSLAGGFASARITRVLHAVSYLIPGKTDKTGEYSINRAANDRTFKRLTETSQMILDAMGGNIGLAQREGKFIERGSHDLVPGGEGWRSVVRVRLLHGTARRRIMERVRHGESTEKQGIPNYNFSVDGYPINQEDMAATLASFCTAPLWCMSRQGYDSPASEKDDFIALWRHIGYYLGVEPEILSRHFSSLEVSNKFLASVVTHLLETPETDPSIPILSPPTMPILRAVSDRPPFPSTLAYHCALTRFLVGNSMADHLGIPRTPSLEYYRLRTKLFFTKLPFLFGKVYRIRNWEARRVRLSREGLSRVVRWQLGMRRTAFRPRREDGSIAEGVEEAEAVVPNAILGRAFMREYNILMYEMVGAMGGTMLLLFLLGWKVKSWVLA